MRRLVAIVLLCIPGFYGFSQENPTPEIIVSPAPGVYRSNVRLELSTDDPSVSLVFSFRDSLDDARRRFEFPLRLSALPGEERVYSIRVEAVREGIVVAERDVVYRIDKNAPVAPEPTLAPGVYTSNQMLAFDVESDADVVYTLSDPVTSTTTRWDGFGLSLTAESGERRDYLVEAYAVDAAGNQSMLVTRRFAIDRSSESVQARRFEIQSPAPGDFANQQTLHVEVSGAEWVRYAFNDADPVEDGAPYTGPVRIEGEGRILVRVAASFDPDEDPEYREVLFSQGAVEASLTTRDPLTGVVVVTPPEGSPIRYTTEERTPTDADPLLTTQLTLEPPRGSIRYLPFRWIDPSSTQRREFRRFFVLDGRVPAEPAVTSLSPLPLRAHAEFSIRASEGASTYYSIDGSEPDILSPRYNGGVLSLELPEGSGTLVFSARSRFPNGNWGPTTRTEFPFDTIAPDVPEVQVVRESPAGSVEVELSGSGDDLFVYTLGRGDAEPPAPSSDSPQIQSPFVLTAPYGYSNRFHFRFASRDAAGNVSEATEVYSFLIDKAAPPAPQISRRPIDDEAPADPGASPPDDPAGDADRPDDRVQGREPRGEAIGVVVSGPGRLFYRVQPVGAEAREFRPYDGLIRLEGEESVRTEYVVDAYAEDEYGNRSSTASLTGLVVDKRVPSLPDIEGVNDGDLLSAEVVEVRFPGRPPELRIRYEQSTTGQAPEPTAESPTVGDGLRLEVPEGDDVTFSLAFMPEFADGGLSGSITRIEFRVDRAAPAMPTLDGISDGDVFGRNVSVTVSPTQPGEQAFVLLLPEEETRNVDVLAEGFVYASPLQADAAEGDEQGYAVYLAARDAAGNETIRDEPIRFTVDRDPPPAPELTAYQGSPAAQSTDLITPPGPINTGAIVEIISDAERILYAVTNDGSIPRDPKREYEGRLSLPGRSNQETEYNLVAVAVDEAGNQSRPAGPLTILIDRAPPPVPEEPSIRYTDNRVRDSGTIAWRTNPDYELYYRIEGDEFQRYEEPVEWSFEDEAQSLAIEYYSADGAGNTSDTFVYEVTAPEQVPQPVLMGVVDGGLYNGDVAVRNETPGDLIVRYELTTGDSRPGDVTRFSPILGPVTRFEANPGETLRYRLATRSFARDGSASQLVTRDFTIDRNPPAPPTLTGAEDRGFYQEDVTITLQAPDGEIFVSVRRRDVAAGNGAEPSFEKYSGPITLRSEAGTFASYVVEAFSLDQAGNRSPQNAQWEIFIDREIIYVSPNGSDDAAGTRVAPIAGLSRALEMAEAGDRKTIFLQTGEYTLSEPTAVDDDLSIIGGFSEDWRIAEDREARSVIRRSESLTDKRAFFSVAEGTLELQRIEIADDEAYFDAVFVVEGGTLVYSHSDLRVHGATLAINQQIGRTVLQDANIRAERSIAGSLIRAVGGTLEIRDTVLESRDSVADMTLINALSTETTSLRRSTLIPGSGASTRGLYVIGGLVNIVDSYINAGIGRTSAQAVVLDSVVAGIENSRITGSDEAPLSVVVSADNSELSITSSRLEAAAGNGSTALSARSSTLVVEETTIVGSSTGEFLYLMNIRDSEAEFRGNTLQGSRTGDFIAAILRASRTQWVDNRIDAGPGRSFTAAFHITEDSQTVLEDNNIRHDRLVGSAIYVGSNVLDLQIVDNTFYGWHILMEEETGLPSNWRTETPLTQTIDTAEKLNDRDGSRPGFVIRDNTAEVFVNSN